MTICRTPSTTGEGKMSVEGDRERRGTNGTHSKREDVTRPHQERHALHTHTTTSHIYHTHIALP
ncbi:hypothetical protein E2C01_045300 [Portunus trituberculatus]|uniref:Uncharacterized protein n=1 Tax=Portunus trituberculatus TaxID=210409 RepID=A0A5B7G4N5_PORTR|nr:hypothetical protein [Portunus trituberculatus]